MCLFLRFAHCKTSRFFDNSGGWVLKVPLLAIHLPDSQKYISICTIPAVFLNSKKKKIFFSPTYDAPSALKAKYTLDTSIQL